MAHSRNPGRASLVLAALNLRLLHMWSISYRTGDFDFVAAEKVFVRDREIPGIWRGPSLPDWEANGTMFQIPFVLN
jgi:hypothetical protein